MFYVSGNNNNMQQQQQPPQAPARASRRKPERLMSEEMEEYAESDEDEQIAQAHTIAHELLNQWEPKYCTYKQFTCVALLPFVCLQISCI